MGHLPSKAQRLEEAHPGIELSWGCPLWRGDGEAIPSSHEEGSGKSPLPLLYHPDLTRVPPTRNPKTTIRSPQDLIQIQVSTAIVVKV